MDNKVLDEAVDCAVDEMRKAKHTCFDRWTDHDAMRAALLAGVKVLLPEVMWPARMVNIAHPSGDGTRIVGFIIEEGDKIMGRHGLSEPLAWLRRVTIERAPSLGEGDGR